MNPAFITEGNTATHCELSSTPLGMPLSGASMISLNTVEALEDCLTASLKSLLDLSCAMQTGPTNPATTQSAASNTIRKVTRGLMFPPNACRLRKLLGGRRLYGSISSSQRGSDSPDLPFYVMWEIKVNCALAAAMSSNERRDRHMIDTQHRVGDHGKSYTDPRSTKV